MIRPTPKRLEYIRERVNYFARSSAPAGMWETFARDLCAEIDALTAERDEAQGARTGMRGLLEEWLETPFFETPQAWWNWVCQFRPRVQAVLAGHHREAP